MGEGGEGSKEEEKVKERKVYRRRSFKGLENSESSSNLLRDQQLSKAQALVTEELNSTKKLSNSSGFDVGSDNFSGLSREGLAVKEDFLPQENTVRISLPMKSKQEALELKRKLEDERDMVWSLMMKIEAKEGQNNVAQGFDNGNGDQVSAGIRQPRMLKPLNQLSVSVYENSKAGADDAEKEKRTPKANKFYKNTEFLLAKDKIRTAENKKKLKSNGKNGGGSDPEILKFPIHVLKSCSALLERLMKHKHGWVFNKPVDAVALGLHDYFAIIKNPMDLGTVKKRLTQNWYKSPMDFAEDVRLTFQNAMTYNPKGQDVYVMAEQLSKIFEDKWVLIDHDLKIAPDFEGKSPTPISKKSAPQSRPHTKKVIGSSEPIAHSIAPRRKSIKTTQSGKIQVPKKPKAKDPNKREMTYDEKQKLSENLQDLPSEKLETVVQIIKKRNSSVSQQDDEIEVDIDSVDTETLWELDRFITNYKKSLNKDRRNAEIVSVVIPDQEPNTSEKITGSVPIKALKESAENAAGACVDVKGREHISANKRARQNSSSSDSGSSSADSDGENL